MKSVSSSPCCWKLFLSCLVLALGIAGCVTRETFVQYEPLELSKTEAVLLRGWVKKLYDDEGNLLYEPTITSEFWVVEKRSSTFWLLPGEYVITTSTTIYMPSETRYHRWSVMLEAGHEYVIKSLYCRTWVDLVFTECPYRPTQTIWLEDAATGEVLAGLKW